MGETERVDRLVRWARVLDVATIVFVALGTYVAVNGGFTTRLFDTRLFSFRSESRLFLWAITFFAVRHFAVPRPSLPAGIVQWVRAQSRAAGPLPDDLELLGRDTIPSAPRSASRRLVIASALILLFAALTVLRVNRIQRECGRQIVVQHGHQLTALQGCLNDKGG